MLMSAQLKLKSKDEIQLNLSFEKNYLKMKSLLKV